VLRSYWRQRESVIQDRSRQVQHIQKALEQMNVKLHKVVTEVTGRTGMGILRAILAGERNPRRLAALRDRRCKQPEAAIAQALEGNGREEHLFALSQAVALYDFYTHIRSRSPPATPGSRNTCEPWTTGRRASKLPSRNANPPRTSVHRPLTQEPCCTGLQGSI